MKATCACLLFPRKLEKMCICFCFHWCMNLFVGFRWKQTVTYVPGLLYPGKLYISTINCRYCIYSWRCFSLFIPMYTGKNNHVWKTERTEDIYVITVISVEWTLSLKWILSNIKWFFNCFLIEFDTYFKFHN